MSNRVVEDSSLVIVTLSECEAVEGSVQSGIKAARQNRLLVWLTD